jgi:hypothetical protein
VLAQMLEGVCERALSPSSSLRTRRAGAG